MEKVITIYDWWDGPLCGLATYKEFICIYERIFNETEDNWSDEYYLTPIDEDAVNLLLNDWAVWCETIQNEEVFNYYSSCNKNIYYNVIESSAHKRAYKRIAVFYGCFDKGYIPLDYGVEWSEK